jgi:hypothetical protein
VQELAAAKDTIAQLDATRLLVETQQAGHLAALTNRKREVASMQSTLADRERQVEEMHNHIEATIEERDQALACVNSMQKMVRTAGPIPDLIVCFAVRFRHFERLMHGKKMEGHVAEPSQQNRVPCYAGERGS